MFGNSLRFKLWRRRISVAAPKMTIKTQLPWPLRVIIAAFVLGFGAALAMWAYDLGRSIAGFSVPSQRQVVELKQRVDALEAERERHQNTAAAAESQINIERAAQKQLAQQVTTLEKENVRLKEDLAFFESLLPSSTGPEGISIRRLKAELVAPNQLRYRVLVMQGGKGDQIFAGNLQLAVTVVRDGKSAMMIFPDANTGDLEKFKLGFRHYQRLDGVLTMPEGVAMKAVQARVVEKNGQVRTQQSVGL